MRRMASTTSPTLIVRPNRGGEFSAANYAAKAARWKALWPEVTVLAATADEQRRLKRRRQLRQPLRRGVDQHGFDSPVGAARIIATPIRMNAAPSKPLPSLPADINRERTRISVAATPARAAPAARPRRCRRPPSSARPAADRAPAPPAATPRRASGRRRATRPRRAAARWRTARAGPSDAKPPKRRSAQPETGPPAAASRACHAGTSRTTPRTIMTTAASSPEHARHRCRDRIRPAASNRPSSVKDIARPAASADRAERDARRRPRRARSAPAAARRATGSTAVRP